MKSKTASANMWWIIIGAVIALVVMIILMVMFTEQTGGLESGLSGCESKGGVCVGSSEPVPLKAFSNNFFECSQGKTCYVGSLKECKDATECGEGNQCQTYGRKSYCASK